MIVGSNGLFIKNSLFIGFKSAAAERVRWFEESLYHLNPWLLEPLYPLS